MRTKQSRRVESDASAVVVRGGTGLGVFQDIQVPVNEREQTRGDGKVGGEENADHAGLPLYAGIGYRVRKGRMVYDLVSLDALQMRATTGPSETQSSSYSRLHLGGGAAYRVPLGNGWTGSGGLAAGVRRSSFNNVSSAHFVDAGVVGGSVGLETAGMTLSLFAATAPWARFGYSEAPFLGGSAFDRSTASLSEIGAAAAFRLAPRVFLDTGLEREAARVTIDDVSEYNTFGLAVQDNARPSRLYDLATSVLRVGIRKEF